MFDSIRSVNVGDWYCIPGEQPFEVVALDVEHEVIEIQYFDASVGELDFEIWENLNPMPVAEPEDFSGALDMDRPDYDQQSDSTMPLPRNPMQLVDFI